MAFAIVKEITEAIGGNRIRFRLVNGPLQDNLVMQPRGKEVVGIKVARNCQCVDIFIEPCQNIARHLAPVQRIV